MKSRYNALKHGIFARVVLRGTALKENKADYENLLESFRQSVQPQGGLEEFLVEQLAQLAWRKGRAVRAEAAIIMEQTEFLRRDCDDRLRSASEGHKLELARFGGTARKRHNPYLLAKSVEVLDLLKTKVLHSRFEPEIDERLLASLFGESGTTEELWLEYSLCSSRNQETGETAPQSGPDEAKRKFARAVDAEIARIREEIKELEERQRSELPLKEEGLAVPKEEEMNRLLRYEARLDGAFDRTLQQLERLQRMRLGQPVPPTVKVDVTR
ncbi:MAG: hypothetical protein ACE5JX_04840 [Acidobacteriota bacterium]